MSNINAPSFEDSYFNVYNFNDIGISEDLITIYKSFLNDLRKVILLLKDLVNRNVENAKVRKVFEVDHIRFNLVDVYFIISIPNDFIHLGKRKNEKGILWRKKINVLEDYKNYIFKNSFVKV